MPDLGDDLVGGTTLLGPRRQFHLNVANDIFGGVIATPARQCIDRVEFGAEGQHNVLDLIHQCITLIDVNIGGKSSHDVGAKTSQLRLT